MRPLTEEETKLFFEKLSKYIGENIRQLIDRSDGVYCFRLHRERVYYVSEKIMKQVLQFDGWLDRIWTADNYIYAIQIIATQPFKDYSFLKL